MLAPVKRFYLHAVDQARFLSDWYRTVSASTPNRSTSAWKFRCSPLRAPNTTELICAGTTSRRADCPSKRQRNCTVQRFPLVSRTFHPGLQRSQARSLWPVFGPLGKVCRMQVCQLGSTLEIRDSESESQTWRLRWLGGAQWRHLFVGGQSMPWCHCLKVF